MLSIIDSKEIPLPLNVNIIDAFATLFKTFYVFNWQYPDDHDSFYLFVQEGLMQMQKTQLTNTKIVGIKKRFYLFIKWGLWWPFWGTPENQYLNTVTVIMNNEKKNCLWSCRTKMTHKRTKLKHHNGYSFSIFILRVCTCNILCKSKWFFSKWNF